MDFGDEEDDVSLETIEDFEQMVGKHQAIIASSSYWGEQSFPTANFKRHLAARLRCRSFFWSPWDKPTTKPWAGSFSLFEIISGKWDAS